VLLVPVAFAAEIAVSDVEGLREAVGAAVAGDTIVVGAGTYTLDATLGLAASGTVGAPITLRGDGATLVSETVEALKVSGAYWHVEDLTIRGGCAADDMCEHALHIVGAADGTEVRGNTLVDFNAQIKGNGEEVDGVRVWPDDVVIEGNDLHDTRPRQTANPVTKIDVVGGQRWRIEANRIADFEKALGDTVSYAAFLKGNSKDGLMARNLVLCSDTFAGGVRVGLSLGGGGTSPDSICEDGTCTPEHQRGTLRNNVIAGCSDVGVYLNAAQESVVIANTLYATSGIDVRFPASSVTVGNNVLDGVIRERDGGVATLGTNWEGVAFADVFTDPATLDFTLRADPGLVDGGDAYAGLVDDFCGNPRDAAPDGGAIEYAMDCDTTAVHRGGDGGVDSGSDDAGDTDAGDTDADDTDADDTDAGDCGCATPGTTGAAAWGAAMVAWALGTRRRG
jgi:uncharacterized protein (TIGR03382 family)